MRYPLQTNNTVLVTMLAIYEDDLEWVTEIKRCRSDLSSDPNVEKGHAHVRSWSGPNLPSGILTDTTLQYYGNDNDKSRPTPYTYTHLAMSIVFSPTRTHYHYHIQKFNEPRSQVTRTRVRSLMFHAWEESQSQSTTQKYLSIWISPSFRIIVSWASTAKCNLIHNYIINS